jgi:hypothetical protein
VIGFGMKFVTPGLKNDGGVLVEFVTPEKFVCDGDVPFKD